LRVNNGAASAPAASVGADNESEGVDAGSASRPAGVVLEGVGECRATLAAWCCQLRASWADCLCSRAAQGRAGARRSREESRAGARTRPRGWTSFRRRHGRTVWRPRQHARYSLLGWSTERRRRPATA